MENENIITVQLQLTRRKALFLLSFFFLCWHPGFLGSENLTLTTYYPAPYGGYASLLTTGQTLLARDGGNVGLGTAAPTQKLDVQGGNINTGGYITATGNITANNGSGTLYNQSGQGEVLRLNGSNGLNVHLQNLNGAFRLVNSPWTFDIFNVNQAGDVRVQGMITNLCTTVSYAAGWTPCPSGTRVVSYYGDGVIRVSGILSSNFVGLGGSGTTVGLGQDWNGTMLCCKIQ